MQILGLLGMYFDSVVVKVKTFLLLFRLALAILWPLRNNFDIPAAVAAVGVGIEQVVVVVGLVVVWWWFGVEIVLFVVVVVGAVKIATELFVVVEAAPALVPRLWWQ